MSFFSFGKKDDAPSGRDDYSDSPRGSRQTVRTERRTRRSDRPEADAMMLDPTLPEKQRARRRLVGALALVAAAVIVLPMVLDSHPKPVTDDISIDIPTRPAAPLPRTTHSDTATANPATDSATDTQAGVAPDSPIGDADNATTAAARVTKPEPKAAVKPAQPQQQQQAQATVAAPVVQKPVTLAPQTAIQTAKPPVDASATAAAAQKNTPASPAGSHFLIQLGTFDDDSVAQNWVAKLKAAGVPAYVEHRKEADGTTRALLRAGPFADRPAASAALGKVRRAGLGGGSNNASAN
jgi:DedD protein